MDFRTEKSVVALRAAAQLLFDENKRLKARIAELEGKLGESSGLAEDNGVLKELLERARQREFGRSSERRPSAGGKGADDVQAERPAQKGHGPTDQPGMASEDRTYEFPPEELVCDCCGQKREPMGDASEDSDLIDAFDRLFVLVHAKRQKYTCGCKNKITAAPGPVRLVPGGRYSLAFAVQVAIAKYADHLPLERQVQIMRRDGLIITSQTLWDQLDVLAGYLQATYEAIIAAILRCPVIHLDETRWPVLDNGKLKENKTWQAWGMVAPELVAYQLLDSRSKEAGRAVLGGYAGVVIADGYAVYESLASELKTIVLANCWAHSRRKFIACEKNASEEAAIAIEAIKALYEIERKATDENRLELRDTESRKIVDTLFAWAKETREKVLPRSGIGEGLNYLINHEAGLRKFLDDPRIPLDNNPCERALRALALGRKNHYGSRSRRGTEVAAILYTLIESAEIAGVDLAAYLQAVAEAAMRDKKAVLLPADFKASQRAGPKADAA